MKDNTGKLKKILKSYGSVAIAFSGGTDSTFLAAIAASVLGDKVLLVHVKSAFSIKSESRFAVEWAKKNNVRLKVINLNPLKSMKIKKNSPLRCYYCKKFIMGALIKEAGKYGIETLADGTNTSDYGDYRPGLKASEELGIRHPLVDAGYDKETIRRDAKQYKVPNWNRPASACLASRVPYGTELTVARLGKIGKAEEFLRENNFDGCRVRLIDGEARIELRPADFNSFISQREKLLKGLKKIGFKGIFLDMEGYRQGSLNKSLKNK